MALWWCENTAGGKHCKTLQGKRCKTHGRTASFSVLLLLLLLLLYIYIYDYIIHMHNLYVLLIWRSPYPSFYQPFHGGFIPRISPKMLPRSRLASCCDRSSDNKTISTGSVLGSKSARQSKNHINGHFRNRLIGGTLVPYLWPYFLGIFPKK